MIRRPPLCVASRADRPGRSHVGSTVFGCSGIVSQASALQGDRRQLLLPVVLLPHRRMLPKL